MKITKQARFGLLAAAMMVCIGTMAFAGDQPTPTIPDGLKGFTGTLSGKVVSMQDSGNGFVLKVDKAEAATGSTATDAQSAIGQSLTIAVQWEKGADGISHPKDAQVKFVKSLKAGQATSVTMTNDEGAKLHLTAVPAN